MGLMKYFMCLIVIMVGEIQSCLTVMADIIHRVIKEKGNA